MFAIEAVFADFLPTDLIHVFEFRDERWFEEPVRDVLARHGLSFCIFDLPGMRCPRWVTGSIVYVRFHGSNSLYAGRYSREELAGWAETIRNFLSAGHDVYVYFNNDAFGYAVINAHELQEMMNRER
jgi:uncharacterized protein YecE (DUF72 family)